MIDLSKLIQGKKLTDTEESILHYMIEHMDTVLEKGVRTVARENFTSPATVMRLSKKLGYNGFIDLYYHLKPLVKGTSPHSVEETTEEIERFLQLVNKMQEKNIFIYATGFSAIIAEYMYKKLLVNGKRALFASGTDSIGVLESNQAMAGMFLTVTRSGETPQVIEKMKYFKNQGIPIVTFTNEIDNAAACLADVVFRIPDEHKLDDRNIQGNTYFAHVLLLFEQIIKEYQNQQ